MGLVYDHLTVDGAGVEEYVQKIGICEIPQPRNAWQGECLQLAVGSSRERSQNNAHPPTP